MRHNPHYASDDPEVIRRLVREHPWATIVSTNDGTLVASHYPVLLDPDHELALLTHLGRPDEDVLAIAESRQVLVILQGHHGYVSPSWYVDAESQAPTWNFTAAHCTGVPEVLDAESNLQVLTDLVAAFEQHVDHPMWLDQEYGARAAQGTVGLRIPVDSFVLKVKLSQDKTPESVRSVIDHLRADGRYRHPALADDMERERPAP